MPRRRTPDGPAGCEAAALAYAARGWSPIPIEPRGKRPLVPWLEFQQRIADAEEIAAWFARWPDANVGIVTGRVSGIVVVDVDAQHGGLDSLRALEREHGALPTTVEAITGGGGRHLYFALAELALQRARGIDELVAPERRALLVAARRCKEALSDADAAPFLASFPNRGPIECSIARAEFEAASADLTARTLAAVKRALRDARLTPAEVQGVVLVGGATRMPGVRHAVAELFGKPPLIDLNPDEVVAL
ncbi:MAG: bifunctional DNA primase/polymerase, partial [Burkholderiaceae bacterium]|nr:bifunctional DNA primase/polymerase [Burkholderiaceae bacterium]